MTKSMRIPRGGDILTPLLGPLALTYAFILFYQRSVSMHTLGPQASSALQMIIFVEAYAEFYPLPIIQRNAFLQMLRLHATEFGAVVPVAAISSNLVIILVGL
jgi:hypothetical protein